MGQNIQLKSEIIRMDYNTDPTIFCQYETHFKYRIINSLKVRKSPG